LRDINIKQAKMTEALLRKILTHIAATFRPVKNFLLSTSELQQCGEDFSPRGAISTD
jgi:hypothetical protein